MIALQLWIVMPTTCDALRIIAIYYERYILLTYANLYCKYTDKIIQCNILKNYSTTNFKFVIIQQDVR